MKPFSLEEYLANPNRKVITRDGRNVRIVCTDREDSIYPVVALVKDDNRELDRLVTYTKDGIPAEYNEAYYTLFFVPEKKEGWINLYKSGNGWSLGANIWQTEAGAKKWVGAPDYTVTLKIEWEE